MPSAGTRAAISAALYRYHERRRRGELPPVRRARRVKYEPPAEFAELYLDFFKNYGSKEARRLIEDHAAVVERRRARANHETEASKETITDTRPTSADVSQPKPKHRRRQYNKRGKRVLVPRVLA